jgi:hypothetical protein
MTVFDFEDFPPPEYSKFNLYRFLSISYRRIITMNFIDKHHGTNLGPTGPGLAVLLLMLCHPSTSSI